MVDLQEQGGIDYGVKPRVLLVADMELIGWLTEGFLGLGYTPLECVTGSDVCGIGFLFSSEDIARCCFTRFRGWMVASSDPEALRLTCVELSDGGYGLCVLQGLEQLKARCLHPDGADDVEPLVVGSCFLKEFPERSHGFQWLKANVGEGSVVIFPAVREGPLTDLTIEIPPPRFYSECEVPAGSMEANMLRTRQAAGSGAGRGLVADAIPDPVPPEPDTIARHRAVQLSRFFPVSLERLKMNPAFGTLEEGLRSEGFRTWQVLQACCTLSLAARTPELFKLQESQMDEEQDVHCRVLEHLWSTPEDALTITHIALPEPSQVRRQIEADSRALLRYFDEDAASIRAEDLQGELLERGLLDGRAP
jgi:hypothetical protein